MIRKRAQNLFTRDINGDSIIQLSNGKLIFYYFRKKYNIYIYNDKTFEKIYEIDLQEIITRYEKQINNDKIKENNLIKFKRIIHNIRNKNNIKELDNDILLIGRDNYLIEIKLIENYKYYSKIVKKLNETILDINCN